MNSPSVRIEIFRHDHRIKSPSQEKTDEEVRLTSEGVDHAREIGKSKNPNPDLALVLASPKKRSEETAYRQLYSKSDLVSPEDSLEDIREKVKGEKLGGTRKALITELLSFNYDSKNGDVVYPDYKKYLKKKHEEGKLLNVLYEESDSLAQQYGIPAYIDSYSRNAGNIAQIIKRYIRFFHRWKSISQDIEFDANKELQRFLGSHASVTEPFLMKVMEKTLKRTEGSEVAKERIAQFLEAKPNGFEFSEGYSITIEENEGNELVILVTYDGISYPITEDIIDEIVSERDDLNASIEQ